VDLLHQLQKELSGLNLTYSQQLLAKQLQLMDYLSPHFLLTGASLNLHPTSPLPKQLPQEQPNNTKWPEKTAPDSRCDFLSIYTQLFS
jgi:hypothetical protein